MARVTVNLTTTKNRLYLCSQTVWSLVHQTAHIDEIVVWVSKEPYLIDEGIDSEPEWVAELNSLGYSVRFSWVENTGPYRKIFPALMEPEPDDILVSADDDIFYGSGWLESMLSEFIAHNQDMVVACRVRMRTSNFLGIENSYLKHSILDKPKILETAYIATCGGGAILQRKHIKEHFIKNREFLSLCPTADDVWISKLIQESGTRLRVVPRAMDYLTFIEHHKGLWLENLRRFNKGKGLVRVFNKIKRKIISNFGSPCCNIDVAINMVDAYFAKQPKL